MNPAKIPPLDAIQVSSRPLTTHSISWSCDAELAVAGDEAVHIFLPEYPDPRKRGDSGDALAVVQTQFSLSTRWSGRIRPDPAINGQLFAFEGLAAPTKEEGEDLIFTGVGAGVVAGSGSSTSQVVRLEWSPTGLGCNTRPVLTLMLTHGGIVTLGEHIEDSSATSGTQGRTFKHWKVLWGLGALLPVPHKSSKEGYRVTDERITSFAWAQKLALGRALLAYLTDAGEIAIISVQHVTRPSSSDDAERGGSGWRIDELARFDGTGPHRKGNPIDPDYVPHGSAFSLTWSPWVISEQSQTATVAYIARNYVGFRRVTLHGEWKRGELPQVEVAEADTTTTCLFLAADAFVRWEDKVWATNDISVGRGVIGTPFEAKPFEVALAGPSDPPVEPHSVWDCSTAHPVETHSTNPITGLVVHPADEDNMSAMPIYSLARLSVTARNQDWFQTNKADDEEAMPVWADRIRRKVSRLTSRASALEELASDFSDSSDDGGETIDTTNGDSRQVHRERYQIWGMVSSPAGGSTVVHVSRYSTTHQALKARSWLLFGTNEATGTGSDSARSLTTEGRVWEWMYGGKRDAGPKSLDWMDIGHSQNQGVQPFDEFLKGIIAAQRCILCDTPLQNDGVSVHCTSGHSFGVCAATGLAILGPGTSRLCAVCGRRSLRPSEVSRILEARAPETSVSESDGVCGSCGGKFVA